MRWRVARGWWPWLAVLALSGGLRVAYLAQISSWPAFDRPAVDAGFNDAWARAIARGEPRFADAYDRTPVATETCFRPPGYPFFLALVYRTFGGGYLAPRVIQALLGLASLALLARFAVRWHGRAAGLLTLALAGTYWGLIYFEGELLEPALLVLAGVVLVAALAEAGRGRLPDGAGAPDGAVTPARRGAWALLAGLALGVHAVARPNALLFAPVAAAWLLARGLAGEGTLRERLRGHGRSALVPVALLAAGALAAVVPVTARNWRACGEPILISANGGVNLFIGNNDAATGLFTDAPIGPGSFGTSNRYEKVVAGLSRAAGRPLSLGEVDRHFASLALAWVREHPGRALALAWRKLVFLAGDLETGHNRSLYWERRLLPLLPWLPLGWGALLALSAGGLALHRGPLAPASTLVALFAGTYAASFVPFFVTGQYRMPLVPWLCLGAGWTLARLPVEWRAGSRRRAGAAVAVACGAWLATSVNWYGFHPGLGKWHFDNAVAWRARGDTVRAEAGYREAIAAGGPTGEAWYNLGNLVRERGDLPGAVEAYRSALAAGHPEPELVANNLGLALLESGRVAESVEVLGGAVRAGIADAVLLLNYGRALRAAGRPEDARAAVDEALRLRPDLADQAP